MPTGVRHENNHGGLLAATYSKNSQPIWGRKGVQGRVCLFIWHTGKMGYLGSLLYSDYVGAQVNSQVFMRSKETPVIWHDLNEWWTHLACGPRSGSFVYVLFRTHQNEHVDLPLTLISQWMYISFPSSSVTWDLGRMTRCVNLSLHQTPFEQFWKDLLPMRRECSMAAIDLPSPSLAPTPQHFAHSTVHATRIRLCEI